jgi:hypothetical protein
MPSAINAASSSIPFVALLVVSGLLVRSECSGIESSLLQTPFLSRWRWFEKIVIIWGIFSVGDLQLIKISRDVRCRIIKKDDVVNGIWLLYG